MERTERYLTNYNIMKIESLLRLKLYVFSAALFALILSVYLFFYADKWTAIFVGLWVPSILASGCLIIGGYKYE